MTERGAVGAGEMEMGNESTGTESVVSIALASPFRERNIPVPLSYHDTQTGAPQRGKGTLLFHETDESFRC